MRIDEGPLTAGFMLASIAGFFVSVYLVWEYSPSWGFAFATAFVVMFIASLVSMGRGMPDHELLPTPRKAK